jgi:predicted Fe-Mo cluster-binding NifX family protein
MKSNITIAIPISGGRLCAHFGHCDTFALLEADRDRRIVVSRKDLQPPPHEPGVLPTWLHEQGADLIIAGGMGARAQNLFTARGIQVIVGAPADEPERLAEAWLAGNLATGINACDH